MIKRTLLISCAYLTLLLVLTLNMEMLGNGYIFLVILISILFVMLLMKDISKKYRPALKPKNKPLNFDSSFNKNERNQKKISSRPFLFGLERKLISDGSFYFDDHHFYVVNKDSLKATYQLKDIIELSKTSVEINNIRIWQVKIKAADQPEVHFKFAHNHSLWNKNFYHFYEKINQINPRAIKSKWNIWSR